MKKRSLTFVLAAACWCVIVVGDVVAYGVSGTPEVNGTAASISLHGTLFTSNCTGEDGIKYVTYRNPTWLGPETQAAGAGFVTDYNLTGTFRLTTITWTINKTTAPYRGVLTGAVKLVTNAGTTYAGSLKLVTQGLPAVTTQSAYGRGWLEATIAKPDENAAAGDDLLYANVEFQLSQRSATGEFGTTLTNDQDFAVVTNVPPPAPDGLC